MQILTIGKGGFCGPPLDFAKLRVALARAAGIPITKLHVASEAGDDVAIEVPDLSNFDLIEKNLYGEWDSIPSEPLLILLAHSDETGNIVEKHMLPLSVRLRELKDAVHDMYFEEDREIARALYRQIDQLAATLSESYVQGHSVEFSLEDVTK